MISLVISLAMLALAPLIYNIATYFQEFWKYTKKILIMLVTSLVVLHLLPESIRITGWQATGMAFFGLFLPSLLERLWSKKAEKVHFFSIMLAIFGLAVHGIMDGAALVNPSISKFQGGGTMLQWLVVLHRLPAALLIWSLFYPEKGALFPGILLAALGASTLLGYALGGKVLEQIQDFNTYYNFQALVAGSLLHIAFDRHDEHSHTNKQKEEA